jgi:hypothetical protein
MNKIIGQWNNVIFYKLATDLIDCIDDKDRIKTFINYNKIYNDALISNDLLSIAIYYYPHLEESFRKYIILI